MKNLTRFAAGAAGVIIMSAPFAFASALTLSIQSLTPGATVQAKSDLTFKVASSDINSLTYQFSDSFANSTASVTNINSAGNFSWTPTATDVGTHTFTISATSYTDGLVSNSSVSQTVTVLPPPSISIQSISPGTKVPPGTTFSFTVTQNGFTNPKYSIGDSFSGSTVGNVTVGPSGNFSWTPAASDDGQHTISVYASDSSGHSSVASVDMVVGLGRTLNIPSVTPSASVSPGTTVSFIVGAMNFSPTGFSVSDSFAGASTVTNNNISTMGAFTWMPQASDAGTHVLTIKGIVGAFGESATTSQTIIVLGPGGVVIPSPTPTAATSSTPPASGSAVDILQAQLAALNAKIAAQLGGTAPTASASAIFTSYLRPGSEGDEVMRLQNLLAQLGFLTATPNGHYGPATVAAVQKFQAEHGLDQLGVVGPATRAALNALPGSTPASSAAPAASSSGNGYVFKNFMGFGEDTTDGTDVLELQKRLISLGFMTGYATGYFGDATVAAVKKFQVAHILPETGFVGSLTRAALNQ